MGDKYGLGVGRDPESAYNGYSSVELGQQGAILANDAGDDIWLGSNVYLDGSGNSKRKEAGVAALWQIDGDVVSWYTSGSDSADTTISWSLKNRFSADGNLSFNSGQGIDFSATSNSAAVTNSELFDDYEEGTWTPGISTTGNSFGSGATAGRYIKIGKQVIATMLINNNSSNTFGSGNFIITGFPYTCVNANAQVANMAPMIRYVTVPSGAFQLVNYMGANEAQTYFYWCHANNWQVMTGDEINNDTSFAMYAGFVYEATV